MITDPSRTIRDVAAAMIWLGLDPHDAGLIDSHGKDITDCMDMLNDAAQRGEIRHYDKQVVKTITHPGVDEPIKIFQYTFSLQSLIDFAKIKQHRLSILDESLSTASPLQECAEVHQTISGQTFERLQRAIAAFPERYPDYKARAPKLDVDVRSWLKETGLTESDAERRVFGAIIREHFQLWPDTLKT